MSIRLFLTTELQSQYSSICNKASNVALAPVRHFLGGKRWVVLEDAVPTFTLQKPEFSWIKTPFMFVAFIPGLITGIFFRCLSLHFEAIRKAHTFVKIYEVVYEQIRLEEEGIFSSGIEFFTEFLNQSDDNAKQWLRDELVFSQPFTNYKLHQQKFVPSTDETSLKYQDLYTQACTKLRTLGLEILIDEPSTIDYDQLLGESAFHSMGSSSDDDS